MRRSPAKAVTEYEELRRLLVSREREELRDLRDKLEDKERRSREVAAVLPVAVKLSDENGDGLSAALRPAVERSVKESIEKQPDTFVNALHPIIGPIVRRSIAESLRRLLQSLNQTLEHTFSWRGLKWRFEALRSGKSFAEVVMLRSLVYRVEQVFLVHRETSVALLHVAADPAQTQEVEMVASMLSAIQDFARDSFRTGADSALEEFRVGDLQVWIASGRYAYLAAVIRGNPSRELRATLEDTIDTIHVLKGSALAKFDGDTAAFESLRPELESCLRAQFSEKNSQRHPTHAWLILILIAALIAAAIVVAAEKKVRWSRFVRDLNAQPGIVVTSAHKGWISHSRVKGLRDSAAADPTVIARRDGLDPSQIIFSWKSYLALDDASVQRRFEKRFGVPANTEIGLTNSTLTLSGTPPYEWIERVRREATSIPGIAAVTDTSAKIFYDPNLAQERFEARFSLPDSVNARLTNGVLAISGEATHRWLTRVRAEATFLPGINKLDDHAMVDLDERTFAESKSIIEHAFIYFLTNKDNIATEGFAALSRLPDEIRRCQSAAQRFGRDISLEIDGSADAVGDEAKNADLSRRRAEKVRDFLVSCGFPAEMLHPVAMGKQPVAAEGKPAPEEADRRVALKVTTRASAVAP